MICEYVIAPFIYIWFINIELAVTKKVTHSHPTGLKHCLLFHTICIINGLLTQCQWQTSLPNKTKEGGGEEE